MPKDVFRLGMESMGFETKNLLVWAGQDPVALNFPIKIAVLASGLSVSTLRPQ